MTKICLYWIFKKNPLMGLSLLTKSSIASFVAVMISTTASGKIVVTQLNDEICGISCNK